MAAVDRIDIQLLELLQENGRISQHDLARSVGLSPPAISERLRKLEDRGLIRRYTAVLDPHLLGWDITAFLFVGVSGSRHFPEFRTRAEAAPEVQECHSVTGQGSHLLKIRVRNTAALEALLAEVQSWPGVQWTNTSIVLSTLKETSDLPLPTVEVEVDERAPADLLHVPFRHHT
jgi:Lrp/AsnC family leucine-responsive transcriptional regulator